MLSHWEKDTWYDNIDFLIVGSGIVGLSTAIWLKRQAPDSKVLIVERGRLPHGASTKNAGFLCFGSVGELMSDLESTSEDIMLATLAMRIEGLAELESLVDLSQIDYSRCGGTELFANATEFKSAEQAIPYLNELIDKHFRLTDCFAKQVGSHPFSLYNHSIINQYEGRIHTGSMISQLFRLAISSGVLYLPSTEVTTWERHGGGLTIHCTEGEINTKQLMLCTNAFTQALVAEDDITPYRNQVIVTTPLSTSIPDTCYHLEEGYLYFRPIGNRLLIGGGRNHFGQEEQTATLANSAEVVDYLVNVVNSLLPQEDISPSLTWSGILGIGKEKTPIIKQLEHSVYLGARLGGMGVAIGSKVGKDLAHLVLKDNGYI